MKGCATQPREVLLHQVSEEAWDKLRRAVYRWHGYRCCLCKLCHHVKHLGHTGILASQRDLDYDELIEHFCRVNQCDRATFEQHERIAFARSLVEVGCVRRLL